MIGTNLPGTRPEVTVTRGGVVAKVTLQDVADAVGVSRMTVSNAFNRPHKLSQSLRATILETATSSGTAAPTPAPEHWREAGRARSACSSPTRSARRSETRCPPSSSSPSATPWPNGRWP